MTLAPEISLDPFVPNVRGIDEPHPAREALRAAGPIVRVHAHGGPVWIVTDEALARRVLVHPRIVKDPAYAPPHWDRWAAGLEPTAAEQLSLTTSDGPAHTVLRRAHTALFTGPRMRAEFERMKATAHALLTECASGTTDLMADFATRYPLTVICELLGVPPDRVDQAIAACQDMYSYGDDRETTARAMHSFADLAAAALHGDRRGLAVELRDRLPDEVTEPRLHYLLFTLIYAGQLTTDASLGFLLARILAKPMAHIAVDDLVRETLRVHPPAPFTLWRFTATEIDLGGVSLAAHSPLLIDIEGINTAPGRSPGADLAFGAGPHYCTGAHLAQWELRAVVEALREGFPRARLVVPYSELRQISRGGIQGSRLTALPVALHG
ncbi:cytochrome P450 [Nocardia sp. CDC159]|uniref:Cytochrome P450 n=1 Tax=Nocardia pulmonis TaxID=2951408 RepID=A0A9X2EER6_9NOCA|nr:MULTISPECIES: cytochrome P450 [Nocardia]MCM6776806.1 cytochrome P450 [Nocardia pulmonis]MCM6789045.1 cytochrome P450 [Nocardia sp. CDC159]